MKTKAEKIVYNDSNQCLSIPEIDRLCLLDITGLELGTKLLYCQDCPFQINATDMAMKNECPDCHYKPLNFVYIDESLIKLINSSKELLEFTERHDCKHILIDDDDIEKDIVIPRKIKSVTINAKFKFTGQQNGNL